MNEKISDTSVDELSYEQAFAELEEIVLSLEAEEHSLEKAISLYERGQNLAKHCADLLELA
ncbi:MAG: exodeoxyribonuclease VII small subunit, partial [candidate division Zixibacteria bacterium]|nr:exodeoxyribonuclease VII small subunit [candidate division Zixibacteria bacterium]NIS46111.1 exodeoxyribonuclease VII small subunit [candidate division Zixibacteria bacterium]NIU12528.1 exodeoxyribonuclease VII small subunit [candidate division Zixibacteria bacterium]NIV04697.1 exodeoxyribonuclease VII small subunit [candidate division Zixibacteria bacterium]NIW43311.1 exodeoxyribonuclease VII small subunit [Gammaproteobacteria bacterium]